MSTCNGITRSNERCLKPVKDGILFCHMHRHDRQSLPLPDDQDIQPYCETPGSEDYYYHNGEDQSLMIENPLAVEVISLRASVTHLTKEIERLNLMVNKLAISKATSHSNHLTHSAQSTFPVMSNTTTTTTISYSRRQSDVECRATCKAHGRPCQSSAVKGEEYCGLHINSGWSRDTHQKMTQIVQVMNRMR